MVVWRCKWLEVGTSSLKLRDILKHYIPGTSWVGEWSGNEAIYYRIAPNLRGIIFS